MEGVRYVLLPVVDEDLDRDIQASLGGFFSKEDIYHLIDVRNLYMTIYGTIVVSLMIGILALILVRKEKLKFLEGVIKIVFLTSLILLIIVVIVLLTWDTSFILFHKILFPYNTYWSLDPASSNLIKYFIPYFFQVTLAIYLTFILIEYPIFKLCIRWTRRRF
jgi:integral membrane protein (TIGR01906 family)